MFIYCAGPYTLGDTNRNVRAMLDAGEALIEKGHVPFIPLLNHFWDLVHPHNADYWMKWDLAWLAKCDALLRLPGESKGADEEVLVAEALMIPVYYDIDEVPEA